jgi:hypothetical protein
VHFWPPISCNLGPPLTADPTAGGDAHLRRSSSTAPAGPGTTVSNPEATDDVRTALVSTAVSKRTEYGVQSGAAANTVWSPTRTVLKNRVAKCAHGPRESTPGGHHVELCCVFGVRTAPCKSDQDHLEAGLLQARGEAAAAAEQIDRQLRSQMGPFREWLEPVHEGTRDAVGLGSGWNRLPPHNRDDHSSRVEPQHGGRQRRVGASRMH